MQKNLLEIKNVVKKYKDYIALNNVNLSIPKGSIYGLLGPNGAGKTTLMRIINQITAPDNGEIIFDGKKLQKYHTQDIGYMPEERGLYKKMKVGEQALYLAQLKGMSYNSALKKLKYWFEKLEIVNWWNKKVEELSKGMAQKIQFIVTIIHEPKLLIFDEPFSGFDPINAEIMGKEIINLSVNGTTIIFSTHRMESVEKMCNHIALINKSETILEGSIDDIKSKFTSNTYEVKTREKKLESNNLYDVINTQKTTNHILLKEGISGKKALNYINNNYEVLSFKVEYPTIEEIFIKSIKDE